MSANLKYVTKKQLDDLEVQAAYAKRSIEELREIKQGGSEGWKIAVKMFKSYRDTITTLKNNCFINTDPNKMLQVLEYAGEERALNHVLSVMENPKEQVQYYKDQLSQLEKTIDEWKKLPQREN